MNHTQYWVYVNDLISDFYFHTKNSINVYRCEYNKGYCGHWSSNNTWKSHKAIYQEKKRKSKAKEKELRDYVINKVVVRDVM